MFVLGRVGYTNHFFMAWHWHVFFFCGKTPKTLLPFKKLNTFTQTFKTRLAYHPLWLTLLENDHISLLFFFMFESMIFRHFPCHQDADGLVSNVTFVDQDIIGGTVWLSGCGVFFWKSHPQTETQRKSYISEDVAPILFLKIYINKFWVHSPKQR